MKILLATDGSPCSRAAVDEVARLSWPADAQVRIISVVEPRAPLVAEPYMGVTSYFEEAEKVAMGQAQLAVKEATELIRARQGASLQASAQVLTGSARRSIVEEAEDWGADLIVVGSHGYDTWERMLLGSVSQSVAAHARCSVLIVRRQGQCGK